MADILRDNGGSYWYSGGVNWTAVVAWVIGAAASYVLTYLWSSPVGATIPAFVLTFALYFLMNVGSRNRFAGHNPEHLGDTISMPTVEGEGGDSEPRHAPTH